MGQTGGETRAKEEMMPVFAVPWETGTKHVLKSLGRKADEHIREMV